MAAALRAAIPVAPPTAEVPYLGVPARAEPRNVAQPGRTAIAESPASTAGVAPKQRGATVVIVAGMALVIVVLGVGLLVLACGQRQQHAFEASSGPQFAPQPAPYSSPLPASQPAYQPAAMPAPESEPEKAWRAAGREIEDIYEDLEDAIQDLADSNKPWEEHKRKHRGSWRNFLRDNREWLLESNERQSAKFSAVSRKAEDLTIPSDAPESLRKMRSMLREAGTLGKRRITMSNEKMLAELAGGSPSWGPRTEYGQVKKQHTALVGDGASIGGKLRTYHDNVFAPQFDDW